MKAKEYAKNALDRIEAGIEPEEVIKKMVSTMCTEAMIIATQRARGGNVSEHSLLSVLREFDLKWRSICTHINYLNPNGWREVLKDNGIIL